MTRSVTTTQDHLEQVMRDALSGVPYREMPQDQLVLTLANAVHAWLDGAEQ